ncbi:MAG: imidazoleglycerol-phosphate dehydratase HisB [Eubacteriaceae bacterium]|jgi:imidazoleglycerol-phosphate dehydratase
MTRKASTSRTTAETDVTVSIDLDGSGKTDIDTGVGFFDHMLELFAAHGMFDLTVHAEGDNADNHHAIEDVGICLGRVFYEALGDKRGITRYAFSLTPMDESLARIAVDISGRSALVYDVPVTREFIGEMETEMIEEFFGAFTENAKIALHIKNEYGKNAHHIIEGVFKGFGRTLREAVKLQEGMDTVPSTKGVIE